MISAVVFLPLLAAIITGLTVRVIPVRLAHLMTCGAMLVSAFCAGIIFYRTAILGQSDTHTLLPWITSGAFTINWALKVDVLTAVMLIVVTWVSTVVHLYSVGYMHDDSHQPRFMAYLSLFTFFMLMLVTADNFIQLFLGWEGVGLASYLLIGFWFKKPEANAAAMKAFIVNRVGDFGLALGISLIFMVFGSVEYATVFAKAPEFADHHFTLFGTQWHTLTVICVLLFIGAMGKSAQLGLHTWLPDAMEGPTPVSALIHAATMVTAGVFLVARCSPLFELAPDALMMVTVVGALTAFFAATIGLTQYDIKRVIAYSTCSQLGYMFFACGVSAYGAGIFHLMTHAFFKALLFLGAGSVIHAMSGEQDMRNMGGIWKKIPITYAYMWIGSLALAGLPFFAGFYSKDIILEAAFMSNSPVGQFAFAMGMAAALLTAFYSWRLLFMTFHGKPRASHDVMHHVHESPAIMTVPLILLAAGALVAGWLGYHWLGMVHADHAFWRGSLTVFEEHNSLEAAHHAPHWVALAPIVVAALGIAFAWWCYIVKPSTPAVIVSIFKPLHQLFFRKWYFDELYNALFVQGAKRLGTHLWKFWDTFVIDGLGVNGAAWISGRLGRRTSQLQTGYLYHYAFATIIGLLLIVTWIVVTQTGITLHLTDVNSSVEAQ
jgi:NADH-quinone oxidoreductase subunit L